MGHMVEGVYHTDETVYDTAKGGEWIRTDSVLRNWIGPNSDFKPEPDRYHLFVAPNCPWAHRTILMRNFKKLEGLISVSMSRHIRTEEGWVFDAKGAFRDPLFGLSILNSVYAREPEPYTGRITVPVLYDKKLGRIVNNESADIVRMLNTAFEGIAPETPDYYPANKRAEIDRWNDRIYNKFNNGVYRAGFSQSQSAYEKAAFEVFECLDEIDAALAGSRYLTGDSITEADIRLFPTLARFDVAYNTAFKCNLRQLRDYKHVWPYAREIYQMEGVAEGVQFQLYKEGYWSKSDLRNPLGIHPIGPIVDWNEPHGRDGL